MEKIIIFGTGEYCVRTKKDIKQRYEIIAFADNNKDKVGKYIDGIEIISPQKINEYSYDKIFIASQYKLEIATQLLDLEVPTDKISIELDESVETVVCKKEECILYNIDGTKIYAKTASDFGVITEVFKRNMYGFEPNNKETIIVDIGMNIGAVTLYFARNENVEKVYGFEPFYETYTQALKNIEVNEKHIKDKVETYNFALSNYNGKKKINYNADFSGGNSILCEGNPNMENITEIEVRKANEVIKKILYDNKDKFIVLKIDCEGSEYDIFESLKEENLIEEVDLFLMEWHVCQAGNIKKLKNYFKESNFKVISYTFESWLSFLDNDNIGMLYAFNGNK